MDDYISRQAAMLRVAKVNPMRFKSLDDFHDACVDCLKELPSADVVEVVRCKDCKYSRWFVQDDGSLDLWCDNEQVDDCVEDYHYCGYAERNI